MAVAKLNGFSGTSVYLGMWTKKNAWWWPLKINGLQKNIWLHEKLNYIELMKEFLLDCRNTFYRPYIYISFTWESILYRPGETYRIGARLYIFIGVAMTFHWPERIHYIFLRTKLYWPGTLHYIIIGI